MSNLYQIVELGTAADSRLPERPSVNTCSRTDLDIVLDDHIPQRMNSNDLRVEVSNLAGLTNRFHAPCLSRHEGESIPADRRIGLDDHSAANFASVTYTNAGVEQGVITDRDVGSDIHVGDEPTMITNPAVRTDPAKRTNRGVLADAGGRINHRPWMYPGRNVHRAFEKFC